MRGSNRNIETERPVNLSNLIIKKAIITLITKDLTKNRIMGINIIKTTILMEGTLMETRSSNRISNMGRIIMVNNLRTNMGSTTRGTNLK